MSTPPLVRQPLVSAYQCALLWHTGDLRARTVVAYVFATVCRSARVLNGEAPYAFAADDIMNGIRRIERERGEQP